MVGLAFFGACCVGIPTQLIAHSMGLSPLQAFIPAVILGVVAGIISIKY